MAYIGQKPFQEFSSIPTKDSFTGDGSTTTFDLANDVVRGAENSLEVFIDNVRQEPGSGKAFTLGIDGSSNYRRITFSSAPASGAAIYVINDKTNLTTIAPVQTDFNGVEIVLDADSDTTLHAETDDQVDLRIAGNDVLKFLQSSGDAVLKPMADTKDIIFQQFDGNKIFEINDGNFVGVGGNATAPGEIRIYEDSDNGTNYSGFKAAASTTSSVAYQLPAADGSSGTQLTTDGSGVLSWSAAGVTLANDANNRLVTATGSGLNGESGLTYDGSTLALTGAATVSSTLAVSGVTTSNAGVVVDNITIDGTEIDLSSGDLTIDVAGDIILDAGGGDVILKDDGTTFGQFTQSSNNLEIHSSVSNGDMLLRGNDGGATITALTLDMSAAGAATFNDKITAVGTSVFTNLDISGDVDIDGTTNLDVVDIDGAVDMASSLQVDGAITSSAGATITVADNSDNLTLTCTDADGSAGPNLRMYRNSSSPDDGNDLGVIDFEGRNDASQDVVYAQIKSLIVDQTDGTEDGKLELYHMFNGSLAPSLQLTNAGIVINESSNDIDFRVETNGQTHAIFAEGGTDRVGILNSSPQKALDVTGDAKVSTDLTVGDDLFMLSDSAVIHFGADSDVTLTHEHNVGLILGGANPVLTVGDGGAEDAMVRFDGNAQNFHIGLDDSGDKLTIGLGNTLGTTPALTIDENTNITIPDSSLTIIGSGNYDLLTLTSTDADSAEGPVLKLKRDNNSSADGDLTGSIKFAAESDANSMTTYTEIQASIEDDAHGSEKGRITLYNRMSGTDRNVFDITAANIVFNQDAQNLDFRVESSGQTHMLNIDAAENVLSSGTDSVTHPFHFASNKDSEYVFYIQNDGNNSNRDGLKIANGHYSASGTNYAILFNTGNNTAQGSISFSGGTVSYNAFTASHEVSLPTNSDNDEWGTTQTEANLNGYDYGTLVKTHSIYYQNRNEGHITTSDPLERGIRYNVSNQTTAYGRDVLGVYSGKANPKTKVDNALYVEDDIEVKNGNKNVGDVKTWGSPEENQNIHFVHVLGDGHILCNNEKGNIAVGDGITCSSTAGIGMKADKTCMIIGMAQEAVTFSDSTPKLVAVQYGIRQFTPWTD